MPADLWSGPFACATKRGDARRAIRRASNTRGRRTSRCGVCNANLAVRCDRRALAGSCVEPACDRRRVVQPRLRGLPWRRRPAGDPGKRWDSPRRCPTSRTARLPPASLIPIGTRSFTKADRFGRSIGMMPAFGDALSDPEIAAMANAARDPYWQAAVRREVMEQPGARSGHRGHVRHVPHADGPSSACAQGRLGQVFAHLRGRDGDPAAESAYARDGVSCTVCHQIRPDDFGEHASFDGGYRIAGPDGGEVRRVVNPSSRRPCRAPAHPPPAAHRPPA